MSAIVALPPQKTTLVTNNDLRNFGIDMTQKAKAASGGLAEPLNVQSLNTSFYLPPVQYSGKSKDTIEIFRIVRLEKQIIKSRIIVDRKTGFIQNPKAEFFHVYRFDPETFPEKFKVSLDKVGYWDITDQYKEAK